jgi:hypothetical protein
MKIKINDQGEHLVEVGGKWIEVHDADSKGLLQETDACAMERERLWNKTKCNLLQNPLWFLSPTDVQQLAKGRADREVLAFIKKFGPEFIDAEEENDDLLDWLPDPSQGAYLGSHPLSPKERHRRLKRELGIDPEDFR